MSEAEEIKTTTQTAESTAPIVEKSSRTREEIESDNHRIRTYSGALAGVSILLVTVIASIGHPLDRALAVALYLFVASVPFLVGTFIQTFSDPEDELIKYTLTYVGSLGVYAALAAFLGTWPLLPP